MDTFRRDALGILAERDPSITPNLDSVAADSVLFTRAFVQIPFTLPSHMSMITGVYPEVHGVTTKNDTLHGSISTLAELLRAHRYSTFAFVTSHWLKEGFGFGRGFDHYHHLTETTPAHRVNAMVRKLLESRRSGDSPGFFFLHYYDPHSDWTSEGNKLPYSSPPQYRRGLLDDESAFCDEKDQCSSDFLRAANETRRSMSKEEIENLVSLYRAGIRAFDEDMGELFSFLREQGIYDRSMIIITSDHGEEFREHGLFIHSQTYDETIAVPLLVKLPDNEHSGRVIDEALTASIDVLPTICRFLGISPPPYVQGENLLPLVEGKALDREFVLSQSHDGRTRFALRGTRHKLIFDYESEEAELYDLIADPGERVNLAQRAPELLAELRDALTKRIEDNRLLRAAVASDDDGETSVLSDTEVERLRSLGYLR